VSGLIVRLPRQDGGGARADASRLSVRLARRGRGGGRNRQQPADNTRLGGEEIVGRGGWRRGDRGKLGRRSRRGRKIRRKFLLTEYAV
jgi:hypothetical protein